jgi:hypothetical protein
MAEEEPGFEESCFRNGSETILNYSVSVSVITRRDTHIHTRACACALVELRCKVFYKINLY